MLWEFKVVGFVSIEIVVFWRQLKNEYGINEKQSALLSSLSILLYKNGICMYTYWKGIKSGQVLFYSACVDRYKNVWPRENNKLSCFLVGDSGDCKVSFLSASK